MDSWYLKKMVILLVLVSFLMSCHVNACKREYPVRMYIEGTITSKIQACDPNSTTGLTYNYNCSNMELLERLGWENDGHMIFYFNNSRSFNITRIDLEVQSDSAIGLPRINFISFGSINSTCLNEETSMNTSRNITGSNMSLVNELRMNIEFGLNRMECLKQFFLNKVKFYNCATSASTTTLETSPTTATATTMPFQATTTPFPVQTLIITVSVILGLLLLLVICSILGLICIITFKKKHNQPRENLHRELQRINAYETPRTPPKGGGCNKSELGSSIKPVPPPDPEYATISEWREMVGLPQPPINNPFYTSSTCLATKNPSPSVSDREPPGVGIIYPESHTQRCGVTHTTRAYSLQDVRSTLIKEGKINNSRALGHTGGVSALAGSYTSKLSRPIPPRPVMRSSSMKFNNNVEHYLRGNYDSPLTQSKKAMDSFLPPHPKDKDLNGSETVNSEESDPYISMS